MMHLKTVVSSLTLLACSLVFITSCDVDGEHLGPVNLMATDLSASLLENPSIGQEVAQINATADAKMIYSIENQKPEGAFSIDENDGILKVADAELFDFEERSELTAVVKIVAETEEIFVDVLIELEDEKADIAMFNQLTDHWVTDKYTYGGIDAVMGGEQECRLDEKMTISGTGMYTYYSGNLLCEDQDAVEEQTGTWDLDEHMKFIIFDKGQDNEFVATIDHFEAGKISLSGSWMGISISGEYILD